MNNKRVLLVKKMTIMHRISESLYEKCVAEGCERNSMIDPTGWIQNQTEMRKRWESFMELLKTKPLLAELFKNNSFTNYMTFMYKEYPPGFGDAILEHMYNGTMCDGALIFDRLKNQQ